tara:strand:+ start:107 stop:421 length:315 start_codon:yes stop_codon:yes gene_type:complete
MANESADFYGRILLVLFITAVFALNTQESGLTGFVVYEGDVDTFFDVELVEGDTRTCADGSSYGECSTIIKPKFCTYGTLVDYCELCGCDAGEVCQDRECVSVE